MDGIHPYAGSALRPSAPSPVTGAVAGPGPGLVPSQGPASGAPLAPIPALPTKTGADYVRALRRRAWLALAVALPIGLAGAIWAIRQPAIYRVMAEIWIEPPQFDSYVANLMPSNVAARDPEAHAKYVPNNLARLRSRSLAYKVVTHPSIVTAPGETANADVMAHELMNNIITRQQPNTNYFHVFLEGKDPARATQMLHLLLDHFERDMSSEARQAIEIAKGHAHDGLDKLEEDLRTIDGRIEELLQGSAVFAPGGRNLQEDLFHALTSQLASKRSQHESLKLEDRLKQIHPHLRGTPPPSPHQTRLAELDRHRRILNLQFEHVANMARHKSDPAIRHIRQRLAQIEAEAKELERRSQSSIPDVSAVVLAASAEEIRNLEKEVAALLGQLQEGMPEHQRYLSMLSDREQKRNAIEAMRDRLYHFDLVAKTQKPPVQILMPPAEPITPVRPNRALNIALFVVAGLGLGVGLVCVLEYLDHTVKVPEHLTAGLALPLYGVVPRIRRTARVHRGGHLWTPGAPESIEADAYRNLRASLLGAADPIQTLLVTSAKAGEGKSTTALNLAATCARAGERTLLMDVDLRRPSLADVFGADDAPDPEPEVEGQDQGPIPGPARGGLAEILRHNLPWASFVVRSDIPNLDFLPTGETTNLPIEVLGTRELRQLLIALSERYDRIILDGPAVLGMADCRMLGRFVDAALLVVRSGAHSLIPLQRAKTMLLQSHVRIAGLVFNGLLDDYRNWSSYGSHVAYDFEAPPGWASPGSCGLEAPSAGPTPALAGSARA